MGTGSFPGVKRPGRDVDNQPPSSAEVKERVELYISRRMRWAGHVARMGEGRGVHRVLVGKHEGKRSLGIDVDGRIILRWIFRKWDGGCGDWMELFQDRDRWRALVSTVRNLRVPNIRRIS